MARRRLWWGLSSLVLSAACWGTDRALAEDADEPGSNPGKQCLGAVQLEGEGFMQVVNTPFSDVEVTADGKIRMPINTKVYLGETCDPAAPYSNREYPELMLLGKAMQYTVDLSDVGCSCAATLYLVEMASNTDPSENGDYYCDATGIGGVNCCEFDSMEANRYAFHSVLHTAFDLEGRDAGYGGGAAIMPDGTDFPWIGPRDFTMLEYGPEATCINTNKPFQVVTTFPVDSDTEMLAYMKTTISQDGCSVHTKHIGWGYGTEELTASLQRGLTPVLSHWVSDSGDMRWLSGVGKDGEGPCTPAMAASTACGTAVFSDFEVVDAGAVVDSDDDGVGPGTSSPYCCFYPDVGKEDDWCGGCNNWAERGTYCSLEMTCEGCGAQWCPGPPSDAPTVTAGPTPLSWAPSPAPTKAPTAAPSGKPSRAPSTAPHASPRPTARRTASPTDEPTPAPSHGPTHAPTEAPAPQAAPNGGGGNGSGGSGSGSGRVDPATESAGAASWSACGALLALVVAAVAYHFHAVAKPHLLLQQQKKTRPPGGGGGGGGEETLRSSFTRRASRAFSTVEGRLWGMDMDAKGGSTSVASPFHQPPPTSPS